MDGMDESGWVVGAEMTPGYGKGGNQMSTLNVGRFTRQFPASRSVKYVAIVALASLLSLSGCTGDSHDDLANYIAEVKARKAGRIPPLPEVRSYESYHYDKLDLRDPFRAAVVEAVTDVTTAGLQPDVQRNREPLESFPLDSLRFVGLLEQDARVWAVITAPDSLVYRVEEGNYLGQNFGRISYISEGRIALREIVPDGLGGWNERDATLMLEE